MPEDDSFLVFHFKLQGVRVLTKEEFAMIKEALSEYSWTRSPEEGERMMALAVELGYVERQDETEE